MTTPVGRIPATRQTNTTNEQGSKSMNDEPNDPEVLRKATGGAS